MSGFCQEEWKARFTQAVGKSFDQGGGVIDLDIYVHIPFCTSKCHYCHWVAGIPAKYLIVHSGRHLGYVAALLDQIKFTLQLLHKAYRGRKIILHDIAFGGGTPSVLAGPELCLILDSINKHFEHAPPLGSKGIEVSPDTVDFEKLSHLRKGGFDRLSIGVQSLDDDVLRKEGRKATSAMALQAYRSAREAGFENINVDLIFGLPQESADSWISTVQKIVDWGPDHVSMYPYAPSDGTVTYKFLRSGLRTAFNENELFARYLKAAELLTAAGYKEYLFGLFEKGDKKCTMDESYFNLKHDWLGFGIGAKSQFGHVGWTGGMDMSPLFHDLKESDNLHVIETHFMAMLNTSGINEENLRKRFGISYEEMRTLSKRIQGVSHSLFDQGLLDRTQEGYRWSDPLSRAKWHCRTSSALPF